MVNHIHSLFSSALMESNDWACRRDGLSAFRVYMANRENSILSGIEELIDFK